VYCTVRNGPPNVRDALGLNEPSPTWPFPGGPQALWVRLADYYFVPGWLWFGSKPDLDLFDPGEMAPLLLNKMDLFYGKFGVGLCGAGKPSGRYCFSQNAPEFLHEQFGAPLDYWMLGNCGSPNPLAPDEMLSFAVCRSHRLSALGCMDVRCDCRKSQVCIGNVQAAWTWHDNLDWNSFGQKMREAQQAGDSLWESVVTAIGFEPVADWYGDKVLDLEFNFRIRWSDSSSSGETCMPMTASRGL